VDWFVALPGDAYVQVANPTAGTGKAYLIKDIVRGRYYYPRDPGKLFTPLLMGDRLFNSKLKTERARSRTLHELLKKGRLANGSF